MIISTFEKEYREPVDPAPVTEAELDEFILWYENIFGPISDTDNR